MDDPMSKRSACGRASICIGQWKLTERHRVYCWKLINDVAGIVNNDPAIRGRIKVAFVPNYGVSLAERIILAGGLTPDNVESAIRRVRPYAVDVSGGVERERGVKDPEKIAAFMRGVRRGDDS